MFRFLEYPTILPSVFGLCPSLAFAPFHGAPWLPPRVNILRNSNKTGGDCPDFAESSQQNGTVSLSQTVLLEFLSSFAHPLTSSRMAESLRRRLVQLR